MFGAILGRRGNNECESTSRNADGSGRLSSRQFLLIRLSKPARSNWRNALCTAPLETEHRVGNHGRAGRTAGGIYGSSSSILTNASDIVVW